jgi:predicted nucleic acid-binding protein
LLSQALLENTIQYTYIIIRQSLRLALEFNINAYDAYFLQCAKQLSSPLITLDKRMKQVARDLNIGILEYWNIGILE